MNRKLCTNANTLVIRYQPYQQFLWPFFHTLHFWTNFFYSTIIQYIDPNFNFAFSILLEKHQNIEINKWNSYGYLIFCFLVSRSVDWYFWYTHKHHTPHSKPLPFSFLAFQQPCPARLINRSKINGSWKLVGNRTIANIHNINTIYDII